MRALWYDAAVRRPGPIWKTSGLHNPFAAVYHSSEGYYNSDMNILDGNIESSWHLYNPRSGFMLQHYSLNLLAWHARGFNRESIGVENEGVAGQPLTGSQVDNLIGFSQWLVREGWLAQLSRGGSTQTLWEHNEVGINQDPPYITACPSGRIPWETILEGEEDMKLILVRKRGESKMYLTDWGLLFRHVDVDERAALRLLEVLELDPVPEWMEPLFDNVKAAAEKAGTAPATSPTSLTGTFQGTVS